MVWIKLSQLVSSLVWKACNTNERRTVFTIMRTALYIATVICHGCLNVIHTSFGQCRWYIIHKCHTLRLTTGLNILIMFTSCHSFAFASMKLEACLKLAVAVVTISSTLEHATLLRAETDMKGTYIALAGLMSCKGVSDCWIRQ